MITVKKFLLSVLFINSLAFPALSKPQILLDYRDYHLEGRTDASSKLSPAIEKFVIERVARKTDRACFGKLEPKIIDYAFGSFTNSRIKQVAYLVDLGDSCHPRDTGTIRLAIATDNKIVTYGDVTGYRMIGKVTDIDGDGINGIVIEGGWMGQGYFSVGAKLLSIKSKGILTLKNFEQVYSSYCGDICYQGASVISVDLNSRGQPIFTQANYIAKCSEILFTNGVCESYQYISSGKFPDGDEITRFFRTQNKALGIGSRVP